MHDLVPIGIDELAASIAVHDRKNWRVPTNGEQNEMFRNHATIGNFAEAAYNENAAGTGRPRNATTMRG